MKRKEKRGGNKKNRAKANRRYVDMADYQAAYEDIKFRIAFNPRWARPSWVAHVTWFGSRVLQRIQHNFRRLRRRK